MTLEEANAELDKIISECNDTVYCRAKIDSYWKPVSVHLDGEFTPEHIARIAEIAAGIDR